MAAEGPIPVFPMDKEAAEEEIALLVRKPGFDELTPSDIVRHMNDRFNLSFEAHKAQLKKMVFEQIKKRSDDNSSDSSDDDNGNESGKEKKEEAAKKQSAEKKEQKKDRKQELKQEVKQDPKLEAKKELEDSDSDEGVDDSQRYNPKKTKKSALPMGDMVSNVKSSRRAAASNAIKQIRNTSEGGGRYAARKKKEKDPNEDNSGKFGPMTKLCYISPELQTITGDQFMKRCDVVKKMWDYIKEKNLKDPKSGQYFLCDDVLEPIFKRKRVKAFGMAKFLTRHIIGQSDMAPDVRAESEREMKIRKEAWLERKRVREDEAFVDDDEVGPSEKKVKKEEDDDEDDGDNDDGQSSSSESD